MKPLLFFCMVLLCLSSCRKDKEDPVVQIPVQEMVRTTIAGQVTDEEGNPAQGVTVEVNGNTTLTGPTGVFMLPDIDVTAKRCFAVLSKPGYIKQFYGTYPFASEVTYIKAMMMKAEGVFTFDANTGGYVSLPDGAVASIPPNAITYSNKFPYSGTVQVNMNYINDGDSNFAKKLTGRDLRALNTIGQDKILLSYGMLNVELHSSTGAKLQLAPGKKAMLSFPVSSSQINTAPATIPAWYFDESAGKWREDGIAVRAGNIYNLEANRLSWLATGISYELAFVQGNVETCSGGGMPNISVNVHNYTCAFVTNSQGRFAGDLPADYGPVSLTAESSSLTYTQTESVPNLFTSQQFVINDLVFDVNNSTTLGITGTITDCDGYPTYGLVVLYDAQGNFVQHQYVNQGVFSFSAPNNSAYTISASAGVNSGSVTLPFNPNFNCPSVDIGSIPMCASSTGSQFSASLISTEFGVQSIAIDVDHCSVNEDSVLMLTEILLTDYDSVHAGFTTLSMKVNNYIPDNYDWNSTTNSLSFSGIINGIAVTVTSNLSSPGGNSIITAAPAGSFLKAAFSGPVTISSPLLPAPVTGYMSGDFDVYRNQ